MKEIGSEFWISRQQPTAFLSGRTALDAIIKDAVKEYGIERALLPSYCCDSMIVPFIRNKIKVRFYDIHLSYDGMLTASVPEPLDNEMIYVMEYFGSSYLIDEMCVDISLWSSSVNDMTHSCFSKTVPFKTKYSFISFRKWFAVDGIALAYKSGGKLEEPSVNENSGYIKLRNEAFNLKSRYISSHTGDKNEFLNKFRKAEELLDESYEGFKASDFSLLMLSDLLLDSSSFTVRRKTNAKIITEALTNIPEINCIVEFKDDDCPLFVPVAVSGRYRDDLKKYLIENNVFCPVHWEVTKYHEGISDMTMKIYENELSLICDQRYTDEDMEREIMVLKDFFKNNGGI